MKKRTNKHLNAFDPHMLLIAATRYFTGRRTISTCAFARELAAAWPTIPEHTRAVIQRDLEEEFRRDDEARSKGQRQIYLPLGHDCDRESWEKVREAWKKMEKETP